MGLIVAVLLICVGGYAVALARWWPVLNDPQYYVRQRLEEDDNARFFKALPKPDREWNR